MRFPKYFVAGIFILMDTAMLYGLFRATVFLRIFILPLVRLPIGVGSWRAAEPLAQLGILFSVLIFSWQGLYPGYGLTAVKELERIGKSLTVSFVLLATVSYLNKPFQDFSRSVFLMTWSLSFIFIPLMRFALRNILSRFRWYGIPVVIYGEKELAEETARRIRQVRRLGWNPAKILPLSSIGKEETTFEDLAIIASSSQQGAAKWAHLLSERFHRVVLIETEANLGSVWVESRDLDGRLALEFSYHLLHPGTRLVKRLVDLVGAVMLLLVFSPLFVFIPLAIVIASPGPVVFRQRRLGQDFKEFDVLKFRTMVADAENKLSVMLKTDPQARSQYEQFHKLKNDPRVTWVGKWLRKYSLDELPQLFNVLKGEMSLTGPRAYMAAELRDMGEFAKVILRVRPGMTGWWQISGRHGTTFQRRLEMDDYYISNWSLWMDWYILLKTAWVLPKGHGV